MSFDLRTLMQINKPARRWPATLGIVLAFASALAATLFLFLVPVFEPYGWAYFPGADPLYQTAWDKFGFDPSTSERIMYPVVFFSLITPVLESALGVFFLRFKADSTRIIALWSLGFIFTIAVFISLSKFGIFFFPALAFFMSAAIGETKRSIKSTKTEEEMLSKNADDRNRVARTLVIAAFVSASAALLYLLFVPAFKRLGGIFITGSYPPPLQTGWERYALWPPMRDIPPDPLVLIAVSVPVIATALAVLAMVAVKTKSSRRNFLWMFLITLLLPTSLFLFEFSTLFLPAATFLLAAAILETRSSREFAYGD